MGCRYPLLALKKYCISILLLERLLQDYTLPLEFPSILAECASPSIVVQYRDNITLSCPARGTPAVMWVWSRGDQVLDTSGRVTLLDGGARLNITMARTTDGGIYNCSVSNVINGSLFVESYAQRVIVESEFACDM